MCLTALMQVARLGCEIPRSKSYVPTRLFLALYMCVFILVSPVAIFRTGFSVVEYCSGSFRPFLQSDY